MGKRKIWAAILALLFVALATALWLMPRGEKLRLDLAFIAYTNETLPTQTPHGLAMTVYVPLALLQASNSGNRPLELWNAVSPTNVSAEDFGIPLRGFPAILNPGETGIVRVRPGRPPWRTEFAYRRRAARERALGRIWKVAGKQGQQWLNQMDLWPDFQWVKCGPITNEVPQLPRYVSLTNHFLDLPDPEGRALNRKPFNIHEILTNFPPQPALKYEAAQK